jgi:hypothetical protein
MNQIDTTYSNITTQRVKKGDHTGDVYECDGCEKMFIYNYINDKIDSWSY